jgi:hypothetical protein
MRIPIALIAATLAVAGCGPAAAGSGGKQSAPPAATPPASTPSGGVVSNPPGGIEPDQPLTHATWVTPRPGVGAATAVHPIGLHAGRGADGAFAVVRWWGGVTSCYALRPAVVVRRGSMIRLRLAEGTIAPAGTACDDMAMLKAARIDLGQLAPGRYTVVAGPRSTVLTVT